MTATESSKNINRNRVKSFGSSDLNETCLSKKWDRLKIICEQKFNPSEQFGLNYIKLHSMLDDDNQADTFQNSLINTKDKDETEQEEVGFDFAKTQAEKKSKFISDEENVVLSNVDDDSVSQTSIDDYYAQSLPKQDVQVNENDIFSY